MPVYNIIPSGFIYSFTINAENEECAFREMEIILQEMGIPDEELELYLLDAIVELKLEETNL